MKRFIPFCINNVYLSEKRVFFPQLFAKAGEEKKKEINQQIVQFQLPVEMNTHLPEQVTVQRKRYSNLRFFKETTPKTLWW